MGLKDFCIEGKKGHKKDIKDEGLSVGKFLFVSFLIIVGLLIIANMISSCSRGDYTSSSYSSQDTYNSDPCQSAVSTVKNYGSGTNTITNTLAVVLAGAQSTSNHKIEVLGWSDYKSGNNCIVTLSIKEAEQKIDYIWEVDIATNKVYSVNSYADTVMEIVNTYK